MEKEDINDFNHTEEVIEQVEEHAHGTQPSTKAEATDLSHVDPLACFVASSFVRFGDKYHHVDAPGTPLSLSGARKLAIDQMRSQFEFLNLGSGPIDFRVRA